VEAVFQCKEVRADLFAFRAEHQGVGAGEFQRCLPGFCAGVAEEDAVEAGDLGEAKGELCGAAVVEEVAGVQQRLRLRGDGGGDRWVVVAKGRDADAAEEVEVVVAMLVAEVNAVARDEHERITLVSLQHEFGFGGLEFCQVHGGCLLFRALLVRAKRRFPSGMTKI
jgi:hypothetical protein